MMDANRKAYASKCEQVEASIDMPSVNDNGMKGLIRDEFDRNNLLSAFKSICSMPTDGAATVHQLQLYDHADDIQFCLDWILAAAARIARDRGGRPYIPDHPGERVSGTANELPLTGYDYDEYGVMVAWDVCWDAVGIVSPIVKRESITAKSDDDIELHPIR